MKYLIRSIKYFIYFSFLCALILTALVLTGLAEGDINSLFRNGSEDILKISLLFLAISAIYPKVGFIKRSIKTSSNLEAYETAISTWMAEHAYKLESKQDGVLTYRRRSIALRITRMLEDRVTITEIPAEEEGMKEIEIEGLRKDIVRVAIGLEGIIS